MALGVSKPFPEEDSNSTNHNLVSWCTAADTEAEVSVMEIIEAEERVILGVLYEDQTWVKIEIFEI